ncbi:hypothetical protein PL373_06695 [Tenacibaculum maritimum]|nr:hypothetical protein [Tenacibaculum maritimum]MDB0600832.1 hypothetical protein [Tenacibaculum maritimum]MDB0612045.1 hypothetical protein [Tenacibaculum maritimum]
MNDYLKKDLEGFLCESFVLHKKEYKHLDQENALNFIAQFIELIFENYLELIDMNDIDNIEYFFNFYKEKYSENSEFLLWEMYYKERMFDIPYTKRKLMNLIGNNPEKLVLYFPFNSFNIDGDFSKEENNLIETKLLELSKWLKEQPKTTRINLILSYF